MGVEDRFEESQVEFATDEERRIADKAIEAWQQWESSGRLGKERISVFDLAGCRVRLCIEKLVESR